MNVASTGLVRVQVQQVNGDCTPELGSTCGTAGMTLALDLPLTTSACSGSIIKHGLKDADSDGTSDQAAAAPALAAVDGPGPKARESVASDKEAVDAALANSEEPVGGKRKRRHSTL